MDASPTLGVMLRDCDMAQTTALLSELRVADVRAEALDRLEGGRRFEAVDLILATGMVDAQDGI